MTEQGDLKDSNKMTEQGDAFIENRNINSSGNDLMSRISAPFLNGINHFKKVSRRNKILMIGTIVSIIVVVTIAACLSSNKNGKFEI